MIFIEKIKKLNTYTNYGVAKALRSMGVEITTQGIDGYGKPESKSMRLDVLCGLRKLSGVSWSEFGKWLDDEFIEKK